MHFYLNTKYYFINKFDTKNINRLDKQTIVIYRNYSINGMKERLILKIKSTTLRNQIESINLLVSGGYLNSNQDVKQNILDWFKVKSEKERNLDNNFLFDKHKDFKLLRLLTLRRRNEVYKLSLVEANIKFLEEIIAEIKANGLF